MIGQLLYSYRLVFFFYHSRKRVVKISVKLIIVFPELFKKKTFAELIIKQLRLIKAYI